MSDPRAYLYPIMDTLMYGNIPNEGVAEIVREVELAVKETVGTLIVKFGSVGKMPLVVPHTLGEMADYYKSRK